MARTASIVTRVEPEVKKKAEAVLNQLGIPMTTAIDIYLRKIALSQGIPFTLEIPNYKTPVAYGALSKEELAAELQKGLDDIEAGRTRTLDEVEADMKRKYEI